MIQKICLINILFLTAFFNTALSAEFDNCSKTSIKLYFANGMFNSKKDAEKSYAALRDKLKSNDLAHHFDNIDQVTLAYNHDMNFILKIGQAIQQKGLSEQLNVLELLHHMDVAPGWFVDAIKKIIADVITKELSLEQNFDSDFSDQITNYKSDIAKQLVPFILAHSQGNLYTNMVYKKMLSDHSADSVGCENFKVESIATPSSFVAACGIHKTLESDFVIRLIPGSLQPNVANPNPGTFDHEFIKHYLGGANSSSAIMSDIRNSLSSIKAPSDSDARDGEVGYYNEDLQKLWKGLNQKVDEKKPLTRAECVLFRTYRWFGDGYAGYSCKERNVSLFKSKLDDCIKDLQEEGFDAGTSAEGCFFTKRPLMQMSEDLKFFNSVPKECSVRLYKYSKEDVRNQFVEAIGLLEQ